MSQAKKRYVTSRSGGLLILKAAKTRNQSFLGGQHARILDPSVILSGRFKLDPASTARPLRRVESAWLAGL